MNLLLREEGRLMGLGREKQISRRLWTVHGGVINKILFSILALLLHVPDKLVIITNIFSIPVSMLLLGLA